MPLPLSDDERGVLREQEADARDCEEAEPLSDAMVDYCETFARELMGAVKREMDHRGIVEFILAPKGRPEST